MRAALHTVGLLLALCLAHGAEPEMASIPDSIYRPLFRGEKDAEEIAVTAFQLDARPVTNGEFLDFVRANPQWQRSRVKRLFADKRYLAHWAGDLELGETRAAQPVTNVSWFAAKAFAASRGKRLPTTAEWEVAAAVGFTVRDGAKDPEFQTELARWYATPSPAVLPDAGAGRANVFGVRDLHGLVWEWTSDFNSAMVTGDARGDSGLERQLFCGAGSIGAKDPANFPAFMRFGFRSSLKAAYTVHNLGFRIVADAKPSPCCVTAVAAPISAPSDRSLHQLSATWTTDDERQLTLGALRGRPQVLALFFASCEYACPILVHEMQQIEGALPADLREKVGFTLVSIDPERDTSAALRAYRERMHLTSKRWTLLRGNADDVREIAALLGVNYRRDARGQFAHTSLITVLNADGEIVAQQPGSGADVGAIIAALNARVVP